MSIEMVNLEQRKIKSLHVYIMVIEVYDVKIF